ncbi:hypothetical protein NYO98_00820 [Nocardioides sp. STR2]|uniref:WD40-like Beta Propeller Repeat n=1 Tax=Nocardioides pini TaxID=2975053 RepID=A0ABT4C767_9ACTN|nr:hypothetical protein [Nocardioides pini]MCY4724804.1 hypothetical protein [Nocardioides pini]
MTPDTQLRMRLTAAVADTTTPPGLARAALGGGRRRRRRRTASALALATAAVIGGVLLLPDGGPTAVEGRVAAGGDDGRVAGLSWARSLPMGADPALPFFGAEDALWSNGERYGVPDEVNRSMPPRAVDGGWLVFLGEDYPDMRLAVLGTDGALTPLPPAPGGLDNAEAVAVSADGRQVAYDSLLVDLPTLDATELPHGPEAEEANGYYTGVRVIGFGEEGLVYEGAPFDRGIGTLWVLHPDGTSVEVPLPDGTHVPQGGGADIAVAYDYARDDSDTCVTSWHLRDGAWQQEQTGCMGHSLGEALSVSPRGDWLLTDDVPDVWNLSRGRWERIDMPEGIGAEQMLAQGGGAVWETDDAFLLPVADRWTGPATPEPTFDQVVQVVRCSILSGRCERAGAAQEVRVTSTMWDSTALGFVDQ